jgi:hypothetical protein
MLGRHIRLGSLTARFLLPTESYGHDVAYIFGTSLQPHGWVPDGPVGADITFVERPDGKDAVRPVVPPDGMVLIHHPVTPELHTEALSAKVERRGDYASVRIEVLRLDIPHFDLCVHLAVLFHKLLFLLDRVVLHGAAVELGGKVCVFLGDKGAGKSTIALRLARAGGTVLGEDHLVLRRRDGGFVVSGCDERSRLTRKTEEFFFDEPLDIVPADFAGTPKKEVPAARLFRSLPYTDATPHYLFFPRVGERFGAERLSARSMLLELMRATGKLQRFVDPIDRTRFLDFLAAFTPSVDGYAVELTPDLVDLDQLVGFLNDLAERPGRSVGSVSG